MLLDNSTATGRVLLRKSRGEEHDPRLLAEHRSILLRLAAADGIELPPHAIVEEVGSADKLADRPLFLTLLDELQRLPAPVVLYCMDIDRLTKGELPDRAAIYVALVSAGVLIRTPSRWYDLTNPDDELVFELKAMFGRQENAAHHRRVKIKWDEMTRKGMVLTGVAGMGYEWDKNIRNFKEVPEESALVRSLFAQAVDVSTYRLAQQYAMRPSSVLRILTNPVYTGWPARHCVRHRFAGRKQSSGTRYLKREEWTWPEQPGTYPALVSREQFERVQQALRSRHRVGEKTGTTEGWCRDVLVFEDMPGRIELGSHGRKDKRYLVYQVKGEKRLYVNRAIVHAAADRAIRQVLNRPRLALCAAEAQEAVRLAKATAPVPQSDPEALRLELEELRRQLDVLLARELQTREPEEVASIARVRAAHRERAAALSRELRAVPNAAGSRMALDRLLSDFPSLLTDGDKAWAKASETMKRTAAQALLSQLVVRITPLPHPQPYRREVVIVEYQRWLKNLF
jgi:DNA invertase Pin-like site-specific DNA recombinase